MLPRYYEALPLTRLAVYPGSSLSMSQLVQQVNLEPRVESSGLTGLGQGPIALAPALA